MTKKTIVNDYMISSVITLKPDMNIFNAIDILLKNKISGAPVVNNENELVGILSEKDCMELIIENHKRSGFGVLVSDFLTKNVTTISSETNLLDVATIFMSNNFRRIPVVEKNKLVGQISRRDILIAILLKIS